MLTALEKLPADRFASAAEFASALQGGRTARRSGGGTRRMSAAPSRPPSPSGLSLRRPRCLVMLGLVAGAYWLGGRARGRSYPTDRVRTVDEGDLGSRSRDPAGDLTRRQERGLRQRHHRQHADLRPSGRRRPEHPAHRRHLGSPGASPLVPRRDPDPVPGGGRRLQRAGGGRPRQARGASRPPDPDHLGGLRLPTARPWPT